MKHWLLLLRHPTVWYHPQVNSPRLPAAGLLVVVLALLTAGCARIANPEGWAQPVFDDSTAVLVLEKHHVIGVSFQGDQPSVLWTFPDDNLPAEKDVSIESVYGEPVIQGDLVYLGGFEGEIYAIGRDDGRLRWSTRGRLSVKGSIVSGPVFNDGALYFGTTDGFLYSLQASDGSTSPGWPENGVSVSNKGIWAPPFVDGDHLVVASMDGKVRAYALSDGSEVWPEPFLGDAGAIPDLFAVTPQLLFTPTLGKEVFFIDPATGAQVGESIKAKDWIWTRPAVADNTIYFGDFSGSLYAVALDTRQVLWTAATEGRIKAQPAIVGDDVVFADESPAIVFVDRATGEIRNRVPLQGVGTVRAGLVARDGLAYAVTTKGKLFRADPGTLSAVEVPIVGRN